MFTRSRYIHKQTPGGKKNGFSVLLSPAENPNEVNVSVTFCSKNDQFCKRTAREELRSITPTPMPMLEVPKMLASCNAFSRWGDTGFEQRSMRYQRQYSNQWAWVWKYFL